MYCICRSITLHSMFSMLMLIIANIVFILFYLQVEPVFLPACLNKAIQITPRVINIGNNIYKFDF